MNLDVVSFNEQVLSMSQINPPRKPDRRIQRTRHLLREALMALIAEKGYDALTVQDVTDRANIARTTFYLHYKDIDDLLFSSMAEMYEELFTQWMQAAPALLTSEGTAYSEVMDFQHVARYAPFYRVMLSERGSMRFLVRVQNFIAQSMEATLRRFLPEGHTPAIPLDLMAAMLAGIEIGVMMWWVQNDMPHTPEAMAKFCDRFGGPGILKALGVEAQKK